MTPSTHQEYLLHLASQLILQADNPQFWGQFCTYGAELATLVEVSLDPVSEALTALYCPTGQGAPRDPCATVHLDFLKRLADGPYAARKAQDVPLSQQLKGWHVPRKRASARVRESHSIPQDHPDLRDKGRFPAA